MQELKMRSQNGFQECLKHLYSFWQKYILYLHKENVLKEMWL